MVILLVIAGAVFWVRESDFATSTRYFPLNHRLGFTPWVCKVKDVNGGQVLVEHADLSGDRLELTIYEYGRIRWIQHPYGHVRNFSPSLDRNTLRFDGSNAGVLVVNGERFAITELKSERAYK